MGNGIEVKSVFKAFKILECFSREKSDLGITEIGNMLDLNKSNVHSIISTLESMGYVEQNVSTRKYRLGLKILGLAHVITSSLSFRATVLPYMQKIANQTNEVVYMGIPRDEEVLYLDVACPQNSIPTRSILGERAPMYCTGIGKAMLAYLPAETVNAVISKGFHKFTDNTIVSEDALLKELQSIRGKGYAVDNMEHEYGIKCVGMPVLDDQGRVMLGLSISGPSLRFTEEKIKEFATILRENVLHISQRL